MIKQLNSALARIPRVSLAQLPTPVSSWPLPGLPPGVSLFLKDDGRCSPMYGGNKVRKLEFLLAQAQQDGIEHVITLGAAGSNHAVATAVHARALGMRCSVAMTHQNVSAIAQKNLRRHLELGTSLTVFDRYRDAATHAAQLAAQPNAYLIPLGGSAPLASLGYVHGALELMQQIERGECTRPDRVYVACGTMGTAVGLALGFALLDAPITVVAVRVTDRAVASPTLFEQLYRDSVDLLHQHNPKLNVPWRPDHVLFTDEFYGDGYAQPTPAALAAIEAAAATDIELEGTYTGKALSALVAHAARSELDGKNVLFWRTLNSADTALAAWGEHERLGAEFAPYFAERLTV